MKATTNVDSGYVCHCLQITGDRFTEILEREPCPTFALLKEKYGIGSVCTSCEYEAKGRLADFQLVRPEAKRRPRGLWQDLQYARQELGRRFWDWWQPPLESKAIDYTAGIFFMRQGGLESHLALSNLRFPERTANINGAAVRFTCTLFGEDGTQLGSSEPRSLRDGATHEYAVSELFPHVQGEFVGGLYTVFEGLRATSSLRPYGVLKSTVPEFQARCHYHDKYATFVGPGYFFNTSPFEPGQTAWIAIANCQPKEYASDVHVKFGARTYTGKVTLPPMGATWRKLEDFFPAIEEPADKRTPGLFWLVNPQHVMVYFMWYNETARTWSMQHH